MANSSIDIHEENITSFILLMVKQNKNRSQGNFPINIKHNFS